MNKPQNTNQTLIQFILRAQHLARQDSQMASNSDQGYAMLIVSMISIAMFSMLAAYMTMTNLSKSSTNAYVDGTNSFYVAESGLNKRAAQLQQKFNNTITPSAGSGSTPTSIANCFSLSIVTATETDNDFECRNYLYEHGNSSLATMKNLGGTKALGGATEITNQNQTVDYTAYTFVKPERDYTTTPPTSKVIEGGEPFEGLNALEYKYTVYSTAKKPISFYSTDPGFTAAEIQAKNKSTRTAAEAVLAKSYNTKKAAALNSTTAANDSSSNVVLQMDFKSRVIPLFQFAAFYEDDLEMDSQMPMTVSGPVHTNSDILAISYGFARRGTGGYSSPGGETSTTFNAADLEFASTRLLGKVTVKGRIYERVPTSVNRPDFGSGWTCGGSATNQDKNCGVMAVYKGSAADPSTDYNPANYVYFPDFTASTAAITETVGAKTINRPARGKGTSAAALNSDELGLFSDKMRDGNTGGVKRLNPPKPGFLREKNYKTGEVGTYYGKADLRLKFFPDRLATGMPFTVTTIKSGGSGCSGFDIPTDRQGSSTRSCTSLDKGPLWSLQQPVVRIATPPTVGSNNAKVLQALQVAIASSSSLITPYDLTQPLLQNPSGGSWQATFKSLIPSGVTWTSLLTTGSPKRSALQILQNRGGTSSEILPPPIQVISGGTSAADDNTNGGFYNRLTDRDGVDVGWMRMLQVNIKSLTYWNRDGIYVQASDNTLTTAYTPASTPTLAAGLSTDNLAFIRLATNTGAAADSFPRLGLAADDRTEGGLVFHATVDDTSGSIVTSTGTIPAVEQVPGKDPGGTPIDYVDKYRKYSGSSDIRKSPYGFVFSGGQELPGPLTIVTDQAAFIQGDYNNPGVTPGTLPQTTLYRPSNVASDDRGFRRQPAAIIADTITVLSNECVNNNGRVGRVSTTATGSVNCGSITVNIGDGKQVNNGIAVNAAFLGGLMKSFGTSSNLSLNRHMRLLENWGGSTSGTSYNYSGSIVNLGEPLESGALTTGSGVPRRNFNFEPRFSSLSGLPPMTPSAVYLQQDSFKRKY